ncbi:MAG: RNA polymerase factor sigma-54 [Mucinivorans sp.]
MALSQTLTTSQLQKLSPQQIQGIKLLELPLMQLEERIKAEIEDNPVLEEDSSTPDQAAHDNEPTDNDNTNASLEEYIRGEEGSNSYKLKANNASLDDERRTPQISEGKSLTDFLMEQLSIDNLSATETVVARFLIGTLDDDGYLRRQVSAIVDDIAFKEGLEVSERQVERVLSLVQRLEPVGIGARNLGECLLLQLDALRAQTPAVLLAKTILTDYFDYFVKRHYDKILLRTAVSEDLLREAIDQIVSLNPKPANGYTDDSVAASPVVIPDFVLDYDQVEDTFTLTLTAGHIPQLKINTSYLKMAQKALANQNSNLAQDRETINFVRGKIDSAKWFIAAIKQRQETLSRTMNAILDFQRDYFRQGQAALLRPMILKDIAERTGFDISTISRVVNSKYIDTHFGVFLLKYFFSEGLSTDSGEEVSTREIKRIIEHSIEQEDKRDPMTDEALMATLHDRGFRIARRTVAKYREMLGIPVARLRREL